MSTTALEQVLVGKMPSSHAAGQISLFTLPRSFDWLTCFNAEELAEFFAELLAALSQSKQNGDWSPVSEVIESWKVTADIKSDPAMMAEIEAGLADLNDELGVSWAELQKELPL